MQKSPIYGRNNKGGWGKVALNCFTSLFHLELLLEFNFKEKIFVFVFQVFRGCIKVAPHKPITFMYIIQNYIADYVTANHTKYTVKIAPFIDLYLLYTLF